MRRARLPPEPIDPEIEATLRRRNALRRIRQRERLATLNQEQPVHDAVPERQPEQEQIHPEQPEEGQGDNMEDGAVPPLPMKEYSKPSTEGHSSCIVIPDEGDNHFEVKAFMIQMLQTAVQFGGLPSEDPNAHIQDFVTMCNTFKTNRGVSDDVIRLKLFLYSLRDKARTWMKNLQPRSITTWEAMANAFLTKFFPPRQAIKLRNVVSHFSQHPEESLSEA
ncbi:hypothetical protein M5689_024895 [Euphorbia peplus]|nr:hypothetical protein M5689_024895 [Euphorbia peplus]